MKETIEWYKYPKNEPTRSPNRQLLVRVEMDEVHYRVGIVDFVDGGWSRWAKRFPCKRAGHIIAWAEMPKGYKEEK